MSRLWDRLKHLNYKGQLVRICLICEQRGVVTYYGVCESCSQAAEAKDSYGRRCAKCGKYVSKNSHTLGYCDSCTGRDR